MLELGISYDVQTAISAILQIIRDIPRVNNPLFGQSFSAKIEEMEKRLLTIEYDETTKTSSNMNARWHQGHLTSLIEAIAEEEDRLSALFVDPVDELPSIDQVDVRDASDAGICVRHAVGVKGCRFTSEECHFEHVDHDALNSSQREFIRDFLKTHKGPLMLDGKRAKKMGIKISDLSDKMKKVNADIQLAVVTPNRTKKGSRGKRKKLATETGFDSGVLSATAAPFDSTSSLSDSAGTTDHGVEVNAPGVLTSGSMLNGLLTDEELGRVTQFEGLNDRRAIISMMLRGD